MFLAPERLFEISGRSGCRDIIYYQLGVFGQSLDPRAIGGHSRVAADSIRILDGVRDKKDLPRAGGRLFRIRIPSLAGFMIFRMVALIESVDTFWSTEEMIMAMSGFFLPLLRSFVWHFMAGNF